MSKQTEIAEIKKPLTLTLQQQADAAKVSVTSLKRAGRILRESHRQGTVMR